MLLIVVVSRREKVYLRYPVWFVQCIAIIKHNS